MWLQALWVGALLPALVLGTRGDGIRGAAFAHLVVALAVVVPAYVVVLGRIGIPVTRLAAALRRPLVAGVTMAGVAFMVDRSLSGGFVALLVAAGLGALVYTALVVPWHGVARSGGAWSRGAGHRARLGPAAAWLGRR